MEALCISTLADECGGWYRLSWRAWRKYVKRKTQKRGALARADAWAAARTVAPNRAGAEARVNADAAPAAWHRPLATVDEVVLDEDGSDGDDAAPASAAEPAAAYVTGVEEDDELLMVIDERPAAGGPAALAAFRWRPTAAERDAARVQAALLLRAREASATYFLHQKQSHATRERGSRAGLRALDAPAPPSNRGKWIEAQGPGFVKRQAETLGGAAQLAHFPALKLLELASRTWHALFGFYATATLVVVEFYLTDDAPRRRDARRAVHGRARRVCGQLPPRRDGAGRRHGGRPRRVPRRLRRRHAAARRRRAEAVAAPRALLGRGRRRRFGACRFCPEPRAHLAARRRPPLVGRHGRQRPSRPARRLAQQRLARPLARDRARVVEKPRRLAPARRTDAMTAPHPPTTDEEPEARVIVDRQRDEAPRFSPCLFFVTLS